jgi:hypothetical protein
MKRSIRAVTTSNRYRAEFEHGIVERAEPRSSNARSRN